MLTNVICIFTLCIHDYYNVLCTVMFFDSLSQAVRHEEEGQANIDDDDDGGGDACVGD